MSEDEAEIIAMAIVAVRARVKDAQASYRSAEPGRAATVGRALSLVLTNLDQARLWLAEACAESNT